MITGLKYLQYYLQSQVATSSAISTVLNLAISVGMLIINKILWFSLYYLLDL
jgi:hypothetical protein